MCLFIIFELLLKITLELGFENFIGPISNIFSMRTPTNGYSKTVLLALCPIRPTLVMGMWKIDCTASVSLINI